MNFRKMHLAYALAGAVLSVPAGVGSGGAQGNGQQQDTNGGGIFGLGK